jgi:hypothetical protein
MSRRTWAACRAIWLRSLRVGARYRSMASSTIWRSAPGCNASSASSSTAPSAVARLKSFLPRVAVFDRNFRQAIFGDLLGSQDEGIQPNVEAVTAITPEEELDLSRDRYRHILAAHVEVADL